MTAQPIYVGGQAHLPLSDWHAEKMRMRRRRRLVSRIQRVGLIGTALFSAWMLWAARADAQEADVPAWNARIWCIEGIESAHGRYMYNSTPWYGEHAQGYLGWLPSTAARWGVTIGDRESEWDGASRMIAAGQGRQFYGVAAGIC